MATVPVCSTSHRVKDLFIKPEEKVTTVLVWFFMIKSLETSLSSSQGGIKNSGLLANSNCRLEMLLILCVLLTLQKGKEYYLASTILATENWHSKSQEVLQTIDQIQMAAQTL